MASASRPGWINVAYIVLFALMVVSWVIMLAGVGASQSSCKKILDNAKKVPGGDRRLLALEDEPLLQLAAQAGRKLLSHGRELLASNADTCSNQFSLIWWTVWFQFVCIGLGVAVCVSASLFQRFGLAVTFYFAIAATILMGTAKTANDTIFNNKDSSNSDVENYVAAARAGMAGTVMSIIFDLIFIVLVTDSYGQLTPSLPLPAASGPSAAPISKPAAGDAVAVASSVTAASAMPPAGPVHSGTPTYSPAASPAPVPPGYPSPYSYGQPAAPAPIPQPYLPAQPAPVVVEPPEPQPHPSYSAASAGQVTAQVTTELPQPQKQW